MKRSCQTEMVTRGQPLKVECFPHGPIEMDQQQEPQQVQGAKQLWESYAGGPLREDGAATRARPSAAAAAAAAVAVAVAAIVELEFEKPELARRSPWKAACS